MGTLNSIIKFIILIKGSVVAHHAEPLHQDGSQCSWQLLRVLHHTIIVEREVFQVRLKFYLSSLRSHRALHAHDALVICFALLLFFLI